MFVRTSRPGGLVALRALTALVLGACGQVGVTLDVSAGASVPALDALRVQVTQGDLLVEQRFSLTGTPLPQSVALVSKGLTRGAVSFVVQGLSGTRVEALGTGVATLAPASGAMHVSVTLERLCPGNGVCGCDPLACSPELKSCGLLDDTCGGEHACGTCSAGEVCTANQCREPVCVPTTCAQLGADCGQPPDGCGGRLSCGPCKSDTCGGGGVPYRCGRGRCKPLTHCDAGLECGVISDGCSGVVACGGCDAGVCGTGAQANVCVACTPATACPAGKECGPWPDGCGRMLDCGPCTLPQTCAGSGVANQCGCTPATTCPPNACAQWPDGCGGFVSCAGGCDAGATCQPAAPDAGGGRACGCAPLTACSTGCVDISNDPVNCGACGRVCPGGYGCHDGRCPCTDAASNADGHCCPPGWVYDLMYISCYTGPFPSSAHSDALTTCRQQTAAGYGRAVSAVGVTSANGIQAAAPAATCGSYWTDPSDSQVAWYKPGSYGSDPCDGACDPGAMQCQCTDCFSCQGPGLGCSQPFYCVMDPLGPRIDGACTVGLQCPPGLACAGGHCVDAGTPVCVIDADCAAGTCASRGGGETGLCQ